MKLLIKFFVLFFFIFGCFAQSPTTFTSTIQIFSGTNTLWTGYLRGTLKYDSTYATSTGGTGALRFDYSFPSSSGGSPTTITEIIRNDIIGNQQQTVEYLICSSSCESELGINFPNFHVDSTYWTQTSNTISFTPTGGSAITCTAFTQNNPSGSGDIETLYVDTNNGNRPCRGYYKNGNVIDFQTYSSLSSTSGVFTIQTSWQCPTPTCQTIIDLVQIIDESGSISSSDFSTMKNQWIAPLIQSYSFYSISPPKDGAIMSLVWFSGANYWTWLQDLCNATILTTPSGTVLSLRPDNNQDLMVQTVLEHVEWAGWTCTGGGLQVSNDMFQNLYTNILPQRTYSTRVVVIVTDGASNMYCSANPIPGFLQCQAWSLSDCGQASDCTGFLNNPHTLTPGYCFTGQYYCGYAEWETDRARKDLNIFMVAVGVGNQVVVSQIEALANDGKGILLSGGYSQLPGYLSTFVSQTCVDSNIPTCPNCYGFCSCGSTCICPDCNDNNFCTVDTCLANYACSYSPYTCPTVDACHSSTCDSASSSCVTTDISSTCDTGEYCTIGSCNPTIGCVTYPRNCNGTACEYVSCSNTKASCEYTPVGGTCLCQNVVCNPKSCQTGACDPTTGNCVYTPVVCEGNNCSKSYCDVTTGQCVFSPKNCSDGNMCTDDYCDLKTGCYSVPKPSSYCNNYNICSNYSCDPKLGCVYTAINCSNIISASPCFTAACIDNIGCSQVRESCLQSGQSSNCFYSNCIAQPLIYFDNSTNSTIVLNNTGVCTPLAIPGACTAGSNKALIIATSIAAGVLAAIIIAVIVCAIFGSVSGVVGWKLLNKYRGNINSLQTNPLYEGGGNNTNPFYENQ